MRNYFHHNLQCISQRSSPSCNTTDSNPGAPLVFFLTSSLFNSFQAPGCSAQDKQWSLCVFDDVIEHTGSVSIKLLTPQVYVVSVIAAIVPHRIFFFFQKVHVLTNFPLLLTLKREVERSFSISFC